MYKVKRRMLASILAMVMVLSLCTGITARAEGSIKSVPDFEGWVIAQSEWEEGNPVINKEVTDYSKTVSVELGEDYYFSIVNLSKEDDEQYKMNYIDPERECLISLCNEEQEAVPESVGCLDNTFNGEKIADAGVFRLNVKKSGNYIINVLYDDPVVGPTTSQFNVETRLPKLALYKNSVSQIDSNIVATRGSIGYVDGTKENLIRIMHDWTDSELNEIQCVDFILDAGMSMDRTHLDRKDITMHWLGSVLIPKTNRMLQICVKVTRSDGQETWTEDFIFYLKPENKGLIISNDVNGEFNTDLSKYEKNWSLESNSSIKVSLALNKEDGLKAFPSSKIDDIQLYEGRDPVASTYWSIKSEKDGVFEICVKKPGTYYLHSFNNNSFVDLYVDWPDVAYVKEEGACYYPEDSSTVEKISNSQHDASLPDPDPENPGETIPVYQKDFYLGTFSYPEDYNEGNSKREVTINKIEFIEDDQVIKTEDCFGYVISDDRHSAKLTANMDAIINGRQSLTARVTYDVQYYYKDGGEWKEGRLDEKKESVFNIDLGDDNRTLVEASDIQDVATWYAEGYDKENSSIVYDGNEKTIQLNIEDEELSKILDITYSGNEGTEISNDYHARAILALKDEYKNKYKLAFDELVFGTGWNIIPPEEIEQIINIVKDSIPLNPEDVTTEDAKVTKAVADAKELYNKLNDAQKKLISDDDTAKLTKADTALKNYSDAVDKINNLPDTVALSDEATIKDARAAYDKLTEAQKKVADAEYDTTEKLESSEKKLANKKAEKKATEDKAAADAAVAKISKLPNNAGVDDEAAVKAARDAYDALTEDQKKLVDASILKKLTNAEESVAKAKKAAEDEKNKPKYSNEWIDGKWYNEDGTQTYAGTLQWKSNATGWWVEDTSGWYPADSWQKIDGIWYYFKPDGYMASNEYYKGYWFNSDGSWDDKYLLSWKSNSTGWWVEDISGWWPASQWLKIDGYWYYFDASGYMVTSQYIDGWWISSDGVCY